MKKEKKEKEKERNIIPLLYLSIRLFVCLLIYLYFFSVVALLVENGADVNAATPSFSVPLRRLFTPLHVCASSPRGAVHCAQVLTEAPSIKKQTNKTKQNKTKQTKTKTKTKTKIDDVQISNSILLILLGKLHFIVLLIVTYVSLSFNLSLSLVLLICYSLE